MKYVAAFLLAKLSGEEVTKQSIKDILSSVECEIDEARLDDFMSQLEGKNVEELMAEGSKKMATVGGGGAAAAPSGAAAPAAGKAAAGGKAEAKKEAAPAEESD
eukprot:Rhum_TRINITY_DN26482_c0_g1::Rhum_TRINITY_DN26482_c0_g1_i1::g.183808::m.183808/K02943/RP-LP2, RPLP2; large subunit ribosomal protein LP2